MSDKPARGNATRPSIDDARPLPARHGTPGKCRACKRSITSHFDTEGRFVGCTAVPDGTVFDLVPVSAEMDDLLATNPLGVPATTPTDAPTRTREFRRARYWATMPSGKRPDQLHLHSDHRKRVLQAIYDYGKTGAISTEIREKSGLENNQIQQALSWLRAHRLVEAREDAESA